VDTTDGNPIQLSNPSNWRRRDTNTSDFRESTIREVPSEESEPRSSVHFDPEAPVTHIYPPRKPSPEKLKALGDHIEHIGSKREHNPLSPAITPDFISAPPTPRYPIPKKANLHKQFSFGSRENRHLTEEETMGLVQAGEHEGEGDPDSPTSDRSEEYERVGQGSEDGQERRYDMF
jgi:hypothetical protein